MRDLEPRYRAVDILARETDRAKAWMLLEQLEAAGLRFVDVDALVDDETKAMQAAVAANRSLLRLPPQDSS